MRERIERFMTGRYGMDNLGRALNVISLLLLIASMFISLFLPAALAVIIYEYYRVLNRNIYKRSSENQAYLRLRSRIKKFFSDHKKRFSSRKTHIFFKCPSCGKVLRMAKGRGKTDVSCPFCNTRFTKKS